MNEEDFTFHLQYKHSGTFANCKCEELSYPKNPKMCDPILVTLLKMQPHYSQSSCENATPSSGTSSLASYKEPPPSGHKIMISVLNCTPLWCWVKYTSPFHSTLPLLTLGRESQCRQLHCHSLVCIIMWYFLTADLHACTYGEEQTPTHYAAKNDAAKSLKVLLKLGGGMEDRDFKQRTPLQVAAELGLSCQILSFPNFISFP